jgi:hypothetical protein
MGYYEYSRRTKKGNKNGGEGGRPLAGDSRNLWPGKKAKINLPPCLLTHTPGGTGCKKGKTGERPPAWRFKDLGNDFAKVGALGVAVTARLPVGAGDLVLHTRTRTHTRTHTHTHTRTHTHTHTLTHSLTHSLTHTHTHSHTHTHIICVCTCMCVSVRACVLCVCLYTHKHTHTHTERERMRTTVLQVCV